MDHSLSCPEYKHTRLFHIIPRTHQEQCSKSAGFSPGQMYSLVSIQENGWWKNTVAPAGRGRLVGAGRGRRKRPLPTSTPLPFTRGGFLGADRHIRRGGGGVEGR